MTNKMHGFDGFEKLDEGICRLCVPFENIYTSVFAFCTPQGWLLADTGSNSSDVQNHIVPALEKSGIVPSMIVVTHSHSDHGGGLVELARLFPQADVGICDKAFAQSHPEIGNGKEGRVKFLSDNELILGVIRVLALGGHSEDSVAFFDERTKTLVSGDCIQLCGVGRWGTGIADGKAYFSAHERLLNMDIRKIIASHEYVPFGFCADTEQKVSAYLNYSVEYATTLARYAQNCISCGQTDFNKISEKYIAENPALPPVHGGTFRALSM